MPNAGAAGLVLSDAEFAMELLSSKAVPVEAGDSASLKALKQATGKESLEDAFVAAIGSEEGLG